MDYANAATTGTLSPHILPITDLKQMLSHIEESIPTTMHLPVSSEDTLHFYRYLHTHILIANRQFLLFIDVPIQGQMQQISIYRIFTLDIPHGSFTAHYEIDNKYLGIMWDETMAVLILDKQYSTCKEANGQFCSIYTPFQPLANPPSFITALYSGNTASIAARCSLQVRKGHTISIPTSIAPNIWIITSAPSTVMTGMTLVCPEGTTKLITLSKPIHILWLLTVCSTTSPYFYLLPHYEPTTVAINISLEVAKLNMINISALDFCLWQHLENHSNETQLQHLASIPLIPVIQPYKHMISGTNPITPFTSPEESTGNTVSIWTVFSHRSLHNGYWVVYTSRIGDILLLFLLVPTCQVSMPTFTTRYYAKTIDDDDVEAAPIYRCDGRAKQPTTPHENHGLHMQWVPTWMESWQKQQK